MREFRKIKAFAVLSALAFIAVQCGDKKGSSNDLTGKFTFIKGQVMVNAKPASLGGVVSINDKVEVKDKAAAILQFSSAAVLTLKSNSVLLVSSLIKGENGKATIELNQTAGSSFSKIAKGSADYSIKTPTAVAGVRGTSFELTVGTNGKKTQIKLLEGKVAVAKPVELTKGEEVAPVIVEAGQKVEADSSAAAVTKPATLTTVEKSSLQAMNKVEIVTPEVMKQIDEKKDTPAAAPAVVIPAEVEKHITGETASAISEEDLKKTEKEAPKKLTLSDIKKQYGSIALIETKNGKKYQGAFKQVGNNMEIITVDGKVKVPVTNIGRVTQQ